MTAEELCIHEMTPSACTICLHGPTPRGNDRPDVSECRSCGASIMWVETESGKKMPIDTEPSSTGRFALDGKSVRYVREGVAEQLRVLDRPLELYSSHFETCPDSRDWKRSR